MSQSGRLRSWFDDKAFGFIRVDGLSQEYFIHVKEIVDPANVNIGDAVTFDVIYDAQKQNYKATNCVAKHSDGGGCRDVGSESIMGAEAAQGKANCCGNGVGSEYAGKCAETAKAKDKGKAKGKNSQSTAGRFSPYAATASEFPTTLDFTPHLASRADLQSVHVPEDKQQAVGIVAGAANNKGKQQAVDTTGEPDGCEDLPEFTVAQFRSLLDSTIADFVQSVGIPAQAFEPIADAVMKGADSNMLGERQVFSRKQLKWFLDTCVKMTRDMPHLASRADLQSSHLPEGEQQAAGTTGESDECEGLPEFTVAQFRSVLDSTIADFVQSVGIPAEAFEPIADAVVKGADPNKFGETKVFSRKQLKWFLDTCVKMTHDMTYKWALNSASAA